MKVIAEYIRNVIQPVIWAVGVFGFLFWFVGKPLINDYIKSVMAGDYKKIQHEQQQLDKKVDDLSDRSIRVETRQQTMGRQLDRLEDNSQKILDGLKRINRPIE